MRGCELDSIGSGHYSVAESCEHGNEPSSSIEFVAVLIDCHILKKDSAPWCY
jgi:hypothetical protein